MTERVYKFDKSEQQQLKTLLAYDPYLDPNLLPKSIDEADQKGMTEEQKAAMADYEELIAGNKEFMKTNTDYRALANSQHPKYVVIACADSREVPEIITNNRLGAIFDIRVAGNVLDDYSIGSIEYAVEHLGVKRIIMLAHTRCGAVTAAQQMLKNGNGPKTNNGSSCLDHLVSNIYDKISKHPINATDLHSAIIYNARQQLAMMIEKSAFNPGRARESL